MLVSASKSAVLAQLVDLDRLLESHCGVVFSLQPYKLRATSFYELGQSLLPQRDKSAGENSSESHRGKEWDEALITALMLVFKSQIKNFPDNIFWDSDFLFATFVSIQEPNMLVAIAETLDKLQSVYGIHSPIRFQFLHDFTYGFDWARWVAKNPEERKQTGLFTPAFLQHLYDRHLELLTLISQNDSKYGPLADSEHRNPYRFPRDPKQEQKTLHHMALKGLIPVPAWQTQPQAQWQHDYTRLREDLGKSGSRFN